MTPSSRRDDITQDIFHLASAVVIAATREKSGLCQEWSSDSRAERFLLPEASCCFTRSVQTTAAACLRCQIADTHCQRTLTLPRPPQPHPLLKMQSSSRTKTYGPILEPNCEWKSSVLSRDHWRGGIWWEILYAMT